MTIEKKKEELFWLLSKTAAEFRGVWPFFEETVEQYNKANNTNFDKCGTVHEWCEWEGNDDN